jgi:hypothetical protein
MRVTGFNLIALIAMLMLFSMASAAIRWVGRRVRGNATAAPPRRPLKGVDEESARKTIAALDAEPLVSAADLAAMTPREREMLLLMLAAKKKGK